MRYGRRKREVRGRYGITGHDPKKRFSSSFAGGYTMVEMVVATAIFSLAAAGAYRMAEGQLDVEIEEDLGIFNPFKEQLAKIQKGNC